MEEAMRSFGIADPESEAHRMARQADPHLQRQDSSSTSQAGSETPPFDHAGASSPESSLRPLSLAASITSSPPMLPPRPSLELDTGGRPLPPPRCDSESSQSPMLVEVAEDEAPPSFEQARRSLEMARKTSEGAKAEPAAVTVGGKPPVPPRRSPRVGVPSVGATTPIVVESPVLVQEEQAVERKSEDVAVVEGGEEVKAAAIEEGAVAVSPVLQSPATEDDAELESDATSFVDAESGTGTVAEDGSDEDEVATVVAKIDG